MDKKSILKYILLFLFFLLFLLFNYNFYQNDTVANYGFSYAINRGEIPYLDFNMVITPFSPFLYSLGLFIFNDILMIYIEQSILLCVMFYFLEKLVGKNIYLFLLGICIFYPIGLCLTIFPGYNFIVFLLIIILFYLFKRKVNDIYIGIILGLIFCTKQNIGVVLLIPSIYYLFKDRKIFIKRLIGYVIPIFIMTVYLLVTGSFNDFINLCFLGLLNFGNGNKAYSIFYLILFVVGILYLIYRIIKNKNDYELYYLLLYSVVALPIIDAYHVSLFLLGILYLICRDTIINKTYFKCIYIFIFFLFMSSLFVEYLYIGKDIKVYNYNHFTFNMKWDSYHETISKINEYLEKYDADKVYYLVRGTEAYTFKIMNDRDITYYDLLNTGNYGLNGEKNIVEEIESLEKNSIILIDDSLCSKKSNNQFICDTYKVLNKCKLLKTISNFSIYKKVK